MTERLTDRLPLTLLFAVFLNAVALVYWFSSQMHTIEQLQIEVQQVQTKLGDIDTITLQRNNEANRDLIDRLSNSFDKHMEWHQYNEEQWNALEREILILQRHIDWLRKPSVDMLNRSLLPDYSYPPEY